MRSANHLHSNTHNLANGVVHVILVFVDVVLISQVLEFYLQFFGLGVPTNNTNTMHLQEGNAHENAATSVMIVEMDAFRNMAPNDAQ